MYAVNVHVNGVELFNSLNREIHTHKQVYMSSGHKREQGKPPFLQCIYAYTGVSEAKELRDVQNVNTLLLSLPSQVSSGYGYGFLYGSKVNQASPRVSTFCRYRHVVVAALFFGAEMTTRPLEHLVFLSVIASGNADEEEEGKIVQLAWQTFSLSKNRVGTN